MNAPYPLAKTTLAHALAVSLCLSLIGAACGQYPVRMFVNVNNPYNRNCAYPNAMSAMPGRMSQPVWMAPAPVNFNVMMARANGMYGPAPCASAFPAGNVNPFLIPAPMSYLPSPEFASFMSSSLPMSGASDANWMMTSGTMNPLDQQEPSILDRFTSQDDTADGYDYYLSTLASPGGLTPGSPFGYSYAAPPMAGMYPITMANGMNMGGMMMGYMNGNLPMSAGGTGQGGLSGSDMSGFEQPIDVQMAPNEIVRVPGNSTGMLTLYLMQWGRNLQDRWPPFASYPGDGR